MRIACDLRAGGSARRFFRSAFKRPLVAKGRMRCTTASDRRTIGLTHANYYPEVVDLGAPVATTQRARRRMPNAECRSAKEDAKGLQTVRWAREAKLRWCMQATSCAQVQRARTEEKGTPTSCTLTPSRALSYVCGMRACSSGVNPVASFSSHHRSIWASSREGSRRNAL